MTALLALTVALVVVVGVLTVLVLGLLRAYATVLARLHDLETAGAAPAAAPPFRTAPGVPGPPDAGSTPDLGAAHDVVGVDLAGDPVSVRTVGADHDTVLLFLSSSCAGCAPFWADLADPARRPLAGRARCVVVARDAADEDTAALRALCPPGVDVVLSGRAWRDFDVPGSPYVTVVHGPAGRVSGAGSGVSLQQLSGLIDRAAAPATPPAVAPIVTVSSGPLHTRPAAGRDREVDVDRTLLAAGIAPGDPSLYPAGDPAPGRAAETSR